MITVPMARSYALGSTTFNSLAFREPTLGDLQRNGPVVEWLPVHKGDPVFVNHDENLWNHAYALIEGPNPGVLAALDLEDALAVRSTIRDFFIEAESRSNRRTSSSSASAGDPPTSLA